MSTSQTLPHRDRHHGEHVSMVKTEKMELLRVLVSERLSAAADEIFKIVERSILEYEKEMSCSKWVVDSHRRLLDVAKSHSEDSLQTYVTDVKLECAEQPLAAGVNVSVCWEEPENTASQPTEDNMNNCHPDSENHQEILIDIGDDDDDDDDVKQERELNGPSKIHKVKKPFKCPICLSTFSSKKTMVRHIRKHPEDASSLYQCQFCDRYFCHKSEFIIHTRTHKPHKCQDYENSFDERDGLQIHRQKHAEDNPCFSDKLETEADLRSVTPTSKIEGELDFREDESDIKTFPLTITPYGKDEFDQESLQPLCLYQIQSVADIDKDSSAVLSVQHIKKEPGGSDIAPEDTFLLSVHPREKSEGEPKQLNLKNIPTRRPSGKATELVVQFETGTPQKPFKCPYCTKCFSLAKTLIRHIKIHTEDKPYQCQLCGRNFCQKSDLVNHTRVHTGERPYQCQECHKSFTQKGNLVVHMRKHTGDKPYQCPHCNCSFTKRSYFDCHMQSHRTLQEFSALS